MRTRRKKTVTDYPEAFTYGDEDRGGITYICDQTYATLADAKVAAEEAAADGSENKLIYKMIPVAIAEFGVKIKDL